MSVMSPSLLDDVIPEILRRLPVKDLLCFRSVSKPWLSLIDSPSFIKLHLSSNHRGAIVLIRRDLGWINLDSPNSSVPLPVPFDDTLISGGNEMIACPTGLVILKYRQSRLDLTLWNPSTRKHRKVQVPTAEPEPGFAPAPAFDELMGFAFDPVADDYKLVQREAFQRSELKEMISVFTVHSLKAKTWERVENPSFPIFISKGCTFVGKAFNWIVVPPGPDPRFPPEPSSPWSIFALDINGGLKFREVPKPEELVGTYPDMMALELSGRLCLIRRYDRIGRFVLWTMNEYGVKESWAKLLSVGPAEIVVRFKYIIPLEFRDGGNKVLLETGLGLVMFDLRSKTVKNSKISGVKEYQGMSQCGESLVRLDWDGADVEDAKMKPKESGEKKSGGMKEEVFVAIGIQLRLE